MSAAKLYNIGYISSNIISGSLENVHLTNPYSGQYLQYYQNSGAWMNTSAPLTYSIANVRVSAQQVINLTRFDAGTQSVYVWQANACDSSQTMRGGLCIQLLSGNTVVYRNSSSLLTKGYPLAVSTLAGKTTIRFGYSSSAMVDPGIHYGTGMMQISVE
jgi:hypothetical protein